MVDAYHAGTLLEHEVTDDLLELVAAADKDAAKSRKQREQEEKRIAMRVKGGRLPTQAELTGKSVYINEEGEEDDMVKRARDVAIKYKMQVVANRKAAEFYVHSNPADPGLRTQWASVLAGRVVLSTEAFVSGSGACFAFKQALSSRRHVYISPSFQAAYAKVTKLIHDMCDCVDNKWTFAGDEDSYVDAKKDPVKKKRSATSVALVAKSEVASLFDRVKVFEKAEKAAKMQPEDATTNR